MNLLLYWVESQTLDKYSPELSMLDQSDRHSEQPMPVPQRIGGYLVEAGLITPAQVHVALQDQQSTGMRFGEVVVARGWLKEQTVEWIMAKVIVPEQRSHQQPAPKSKQAPIASTPQVSRSSGISSADLHDPELINGLTQVRSIARNNPTSTSSASATHSTQQMPLSGSTQPGTEKSLDRRPPISKPLPSVNSADEDVSWVG